MANVKWQMWCGVVVLAGLLMGCKEDSGGKSSGERVLNLYSWSEYFPQEVRDEFTKRTGIKVNLTVFENNEVLVDKLNAGVSSFDLVVPSDYTIALLKRTGRLQKIDQGKIANWKSLDPRLLGRAYDAKNEYSMPYFYGTTGIGFNREVTGEVDSWNALFDAKHAGKILMLDDGRECLVAALKTMGKSVNEKDEAVLKQAGEKLKAQKPIVRTYNSNDFDQTLARGDVVLAHGYNGQLAKVMAGNAKKFGYVVPKEGGTMWIDGLCIPAKAKNVAEAHEFLNFLLEPQIGGQIVNEASYASANLAARAHVKKEIVEDPAIYPTDEVMKRCEVMEDLGEGTTDVIDKIWRGVKVK